MLKYKDIYGYGLSLFRYRRHFLSFFTSTRCIKIISWSNHLYLWWLAFFVIPRLPGKLTTFTCPQSETLQWLNNLLTTRKIFVRYTVQADMRYNDSVHHVLNKDMLSFWITNCKNDVVSTQKVDILFYAVISTFQSWLLVVLKIYDIQ